MLKIKELNSFYIMAKIYSKGLKLTVIAFEQELVSI